MQAEIIAIGDEVLIGQTVDTNSAFIASRLNLNGISVKQKRVIADDKEAICSALDQVLPGTGLVFITGGLGPTKDDITKETLAEYFGGSLQYHPEVFEHIRRLFAGFGRQPGESNRSQAFLPSACHIIHNAVGTAMGMRFEKNGTFFFSLPGVPYETRHLIDKEVLPWLRANVQRSTVVHRTILTQGVAESILAERLKEWEDQLPRTIKLAYLPSAGLVKLRLSCYTAPENEARALVDAQTAKMISILGEVVYGEDRDTLEEVVGTLLLQKNATLSIAESCTGGHISHKITSVAGSSQYYKGSVVAYSNGCKTELLGVDAAVIAKHGVVSREVAEQMAAGAQKKFQSDFAVATTGYAGPSGGTEMQPVGSVWIAIATPDELLSREFNFGKDRARNIKRATFMSLDLLRRAVQKFEY